jgi:uncharacterized membrane protein
MTRARWYGVLTERWDALRSSYWIVPASMALLSGALAVVAVELDRRGTVGPWSAIPWSSGVSPDGARAVLAAIAGSMMTVTGVVFSITVVALTLTSSQFGPRLLRTFFRDRASQLSLGTFIATFSYSLLVLWAAGSSAAVPAVATTGAVALAVISLFVLIYFIHHAARSLQASSVVAAVACEIREQLRLLRPEPGGEEDAGAPDEDEQERLRHLGSEGADLPSAAEGYVRAVDEETILRLAAARDLLVRVDACPGRFVADGFPLARIHPPDALDDDLRSRLRRCWVVGDHRTPAQDVSFLVEQLSEMAVRALSPGVNDPETAVECVHRISAALALLARRALPSGRRRDEAGTLRVVAEPTRFESIAARAFDPIRRHAGEQPEVIAALLAAIESVGGPEVAGSRRATLMEHAHEIHREFERSSTARSDRDRAQVDAAYARARASAGGRAGGPVVMPAQALRAASGRR